MKGKSCIPENLFKPTAGFAETERMMRTGMPADSIRARAPATAPQHDAGYMAATFPSAEQRFPSCNAGRTIYGLTASRMRSACCLRGSGTSAPAPLRQHARAYAYRGLRALASLSMARSGGSCGVPPAQDEGRQQTALALTRLGGGDLGQMGVAGGGLRVGVAEDALQLAQIHAQLQHVGRKGVP